MRYGCRRGDGVHRTDLHARSHHAERQGGIAVDHDLRLSRLDRRNVVLEAEIGFGPGIAGFHQFDIGVDDGSALVVENEGNLLARHLRLEAVDVAEQAEHEHVLAALGIGHQAQAFLFHRNFINLAARCQKVFMGSLIGLDDRRIPVVAPFVFQQNDAALFKFSFAYPAHQDLFVEGDDEVGLVAAVGDVFGADADAVSAGPFDAARGGLDFGRNDFDRPDAVAFAGGDGGEGLAAFLRPFSGIADYFDDMFVQRSDILCHRGESVAAVSFGQQFGFQCRIHVHRVVCREIFRSGSITIKPCAGARSSVLPDRCRIIWRRRRRLRQDRRCPYRVSSDRI